MLLQTIKSRNLWLWGEVVVPEKDASEEQKLQATIQDLEKQRTDIINKGYKDSKNNTQEYQEALSKTNAEIVDKKVQLYKLTDKQGSSFGSSSFDNSVNNVQYYRSYTVPFKITALQSIDIQWDNPIGESYGIKTNFLQAWHNKPVNINFSGISYMGAFGGQTVGDLAESMEDNKSSVTKAVESVTGTVGNITGAITSGVSSAINAVQDGLNKDKLISEVEGKYNIIVDNDIFKINSLMSKYGEGMFTSSSAAESSFWTHLLIENEMGADGKSSYAMFVGHIKNFSYKENVNKPFLYDFTCQFVGEPTQTQAIKQGQITAQDDKNSLKLSLVTSDSGYSLGYGF